MLKHINWIVPAIVIVAVLAGLFAAFIPQGSVYAAADTVTGGPGGGGNGRGGRGGNGAGVPGTGIALTPLTAEESAALQSAILEEYLARNTYAAVIEQLGSVVPFNQIVVSEQAHIDALVKQATKYGVAIPADPGLNQPVTVASLAEACQLGVDLETADAALYDTLKPVTSHSDLLRVYTTLQNASLLRHLPEFQACD